jgi:hypothetical protein
MSNEADIPLNRDEVILGKDKSIAEIDEIQRRNEAAIENGKAYRW